MPKQPVYERVLEQRPDLPVLRAMLKQSVHDRVLEQRPDLSALRLMYRQQRGHDRLYRRRQRRPDLQYRMQ